MIIYCPIIGCTANNITRLMYIYFYRRVAVLCSIKWKLYFNSVVKFLLRPNESDRQKRRHTIQIQIQSREPGDVYKFYPLVLPLSALFCLKIFRHIFLCFVWFRMQQATECNKNIDNLKYHSPL